MATKKTVAAEDTTPVVSTDDKAVVALTNENKDLKLRIAQLEKKVDTALKSVESELAMLVDNRRENEGDDRLIRKWTEIVLHKFYTGEKPDEE